MKVILSTRTVFPFHGYGGAESYPYYLAKYLLREGINVKIVSSLSKGKIKKAKYNGIEYVFLSPLIVKRKLIGPWKMLYYVNLARYLKREKMDILHSFLDSSYMYLHLHNRRPTIVQQGGLEPFTDPAYLGSKGIKRMYIDITVRHPWKYCLIHADAVAIEGDFQLEVLQRLGIKREKIFNLPVGIDLSFIKEKLETGRPSRKDLGLSDNDFVLISVNRFTPDKGINYLVDGFRLLKKKINSSKLILIGRVEHERDKNLYEQIKTMIRKYELKNEVILIKNARENTLLDYYSVSDVYVSPTLQDDFIMSIQEAMAFGLPIVSTDQAFLVKHGVNGYIVPKKNPQAISDAVLRIYEGNMCKRMGRFSKKFAEKYGFETIAKKAITKYEELID